MLSGLRCGASRRWPSRPRPPSHRRPPARPPSRPRPQDGSTLIEVLVAMALIGIVMSALTTFFVRALAITDQQGDRQAAVQLAVDAGELAGRIGPDTVLNGRGECTATNCETPVRGAADLLDGVHHIDHHTERWDAPAGAPAATLPVAPVAVQINGIEYLQHWYVGKCWQPVAGGTCNLNGPRRATAHYIEFFRIVVAVTWPDRDCVDNTCSYATATLIDTRADDPVFNADDTATSPVPGGTDNQVAYRGERIATLVFDSTGGMAPFSWEFSGLPPGLYGNATGEVTGTPSQAGVFDVTATVTGYNNKAGSTRFQWKVFEALVITEPGDQSTTGGDEVNLPVRTAGGTAPLEFSATGLPPDLSIDAASGLISGRPTSATGPNPVTVTVTDSTGQSGSTTFLWTITEPPPPAATEPAPPPADGPAPLAITTPGEQTSIRDVAIEAQQVAFASGGSPAYQWSASGLPDGLSIDPQSGTVSGTATTAGNVDGVRIQVRDAAGTEVATEEFRWKVEKK